jgi:hypothetical protein
MSMKNARFAALLALATLAATGPAVAQIKKIATLKLQMIGNGYVAYQVGGKNTHCTGKGDQGQVGQCSATFPYGASVKLTASQPKGGWFEGWGGAAQSCGKMAVCTIKVSGITNVTASFGPYKP